MRKVVKSEMPADLACVTASGIGKALRAQRTGSGMSIEQTARMLGISKNTYCSMECGDGKASLTTYLTAIAALGIKMDLRCHQTDLNTSQQNQERAFLIPRERARRSVVHWNHEAHEGMGI